MGPPDPEPPDAAEAKAATRRMIWGDVDPLEAEVLWQGRKVKGKDLPWMHPDWRPDFGWVSGPGIVRAPDDPYAPKSARPLPEPPEPPPPPTEAEREAVLAWLDLAIEYRLNQRPPARNLPAQRLQMLTVALDYWATPYDLACAIRDGHWWPPPAGYRLHPPERSHRDPARLARAHRRATRAEGMLRSAARLGRNLASGGVGRRSKDVSISRTRLPGPLRRAEARETMIVTRCSEICRASDEIMTLRAPMHPVTGRGTPGSVGRRPAFLSAVRR